MRYMLILSDCFTMTMREEPRGHRLTFVLFGGDRPIPRQRIEFIYVTVLSFVRWISRIDIAPWRWSWPSPRRLILRPIKRSSKGKVSFDTTRNSLLFSHADMRATVQTSATIDDDKGPTRCT
jgi:hypothetical protein